MSKGAGGRFRRKRDSLDLLNPWRLESSAPLLYLSRLKFAQVSRTSQTEAVSCLARPCAMAAV
jgi:hypothetical protein